MSSNSKIEWTDHTFNPWWGCVKVHVGCKHCYAENLDKRTGGKHWGPNTQRRMILHEWVKIAKWHAAAAAAGVPALVFCASMCDIFERYRLGPVVDQRGKMIEAPASIRERYGKLLWAGIDWTVEALRARLWDIIEETPHLTWLLLTKRPENIREMVPERWLTNWPANVWTGTSVSDQETADEFVPRLLDVPGPHFLSLEPQVGPVDLSPPSARGSGLWVRPGSQSLGMHRHISWVIQGAMSGSNDSPFDMAWADMTREQCAAAGTPYFLKQIGPRAYDMSRAGSVPGAKRKITAEALRIPEQAEQAAKVLGDIFDAIHVVVSDKKGGDTNDWPEQYRVRQFPAEFRRAS